MALHMLCAYAHDHIRGRKFANELMEGFVLRLDRNVRATCQLLPSKMLFLLCAGLAARPINSSPEFWELEVAISLWLPVDCLLLAWIAAFVLFAGGRGIPG